MDWAILGGFLTKLTQKCNIVQREAIRLGYT